MKFNNLGLALGIVWKFYASVAKESKLNVRKFRGLVPVLIKVIGEKLVGGAFLGPSSLIGLILGSNRLFLYRNGVLLILVLSTKNRYSSFFEKCFRFKVLKKFKISSDLSNKNMRISQTEGYLNSLVPFFRRTYALAVAFKMKPLRKSVFMC